MTAMPMYKNVTPPHAALKSAIGLNLPTYHELTQADLERVGAAVNEELRVLFSR